VLKINVAKLQPVSSRLTGAIIGQSHADQVRELINRATPSTPQIVNLDFSGIESASSSYLKRLLSPFFPPPNDASMPKMEAFPVATRVEHSDLREELEDYLAGKGLALVEADTLAGKPKFRHLLGRLDGAAMETFNELRKLKTTTAVQLYERHRDETTNQTAWNNRLAHLVAKRVAHRIRDGRFWIYEPTVKS
jgi:hypothetical protein